MKHQNVVNERHITLEEPKGVVAIRRTAAAEDADATMDRFRDVADAHYETPRVPVHDGFEGGSWMFMRSNNEGAWTVDECAAPKGVDDAQRVFQHQSVRTYLGLDCLAGAVGLEFHDELGPWLRMLHGTTNSLDIARLRLRKLWCSTVSTALASNEVTA